MIDSAMVLKNSDVLNNQDKLHHLSASEQEVTQLMLQFVELFLDVPV